jgi:hypothetical protein
MNGPQRNIWLEREVEDNERVHKAIKAHMPHVLRVATPTLAGAWDRMVVGGVVVKEDLVRLSHVRATRPRRRGAIDDEMNGRRLAARSSDLGVKVDPAGDTSTDRGVDDGRMDEVIVGGAQGHPTGISLFEDVHPAR